MRGMELFGKPYCLHCLDERILESKNFEIVVNEAKAKRTEDGTAVQSQGERRIADYLSLKGVRYVYDERYRIAGDVRIRPDFYLPEFDLYIEYWGMDTPEYVENMKKKLFLYQRAGKKLISLSFRDFDRGLRSLRSLRPPHSASSSQEADVPSKAGAEGALTQQRARKE